MYKAILCPKCNGRGYISGHDDHSIWSEICTECNGECTVLGLMTNGEIIRKCNNEDLVKVFNNLNKWAIYSGGNDNRLLFKSDPEDFLLWLNKEVDKIDMETIFDFIDEDKHDEEYNLAKTDTEVKRYEIHY